MKSVRVEEMLQKYIKGAVFFFFFQAEDGIRDSDM